MLSLAESVVTPPSTIGSPVVTVRRQNNDPTLLYFLDSGLAAENITSTPDAGRILVGTSDGHHLRTLVTSQKTPDGIVVSLAEGKLFWTVMGSSGASDGTILSSTVDGQTIETIVPPGAIHTPKQITIDRQNSKLYIADREGMRILRCNLDGSDLEVLIQTGSLEREDERNDKTRWCVGVAVSPRTGKFYWTQKGPPKGNQGRIFRANIEFPFGQQAETRDDIELLLQNLPEPIDLDIDESNNTIYWTDRGELPLGNSINRMSLDKVEVVQEQNASSIPWLEGRYEIVVRNLHEAIGIQLDLKNRHIYATDLGGAVYQFDMNGENKKALYQDGSAYTGIAIAHI
ncbi:3-hydroxyacyl-CoA dehydrogenase [Hypomontagnella submonticulosa]|nr:3-hydroxyacyl-CoA dehydrogenase [Hypomontagnella submonticulosa]